MTIHGDSELSFISFAKIQRHLSNHQFLMKGGNNRIKFQTNDDVIARLDGTGWKPKSKNKTKTKQNKKHDHLKWNNVTLQRLKEVVPILTCVFPTLKLLTLTHKTHIAKFYLKFTFYFLS